MLGLLEMCADTICTLAQCFGHNNTVVRDNMIKSL